MADTGRRHGPTPVIIDCDPGIDDAVALGVALNSPEVEVLAVTTVSGNSPLPVTTANALRVLNLLGGGDVLVAPGASRPLVHRRHHNRISPHGANGVGGVSLPTETRPPVGIHAVDLMARLLLERPAGSVTLVALGPLTNVALLFGLHPEVCSRLARIVFMGGSLGVGNITPVAEFNVWTDPEAAHRVIVDSDVDVTLVGLNVTTRATVDEDILAVLERSSDAGGVLSSMIRGYRDRRATGWAMHDVLALGAVVDPAVIATTTATVEIDTSHGHGCGQTIYAQEELWDHYAMADPGSPPRGKRITLATDLDVDRFRDLFVARLATAPDD